MIISEEFCIPIQCKDNFHKVLLIYLQHTLSIFFTNLNMTNQVISIKGRVVREPEMQKSKSDNEFLTIPIAVNVQEKNEKGEKEWVPYYYDALVFGKNTENYRELKKGQMIRVNGDFKAEAYLYKKEAKLSQKIFVEEISVIPEGKKML